MRSIVASVVSGCLSAKLLSTSRRELAEHLCGPPGCCCWLVAALGTTPTSSRSTLGPLAARCVWWELASCWRRCTGASQVASGGRAAMDATEVLFRDSRDIQPPGAAFEKGKGPHDNPYSSLEPALFVACPEDIWQPVTAEADESGNVEVKVCATARPPHRGRRAPPTAPPPIFFFATQPLGCARALSCLRRANRTRTCSWST